MDRTGLIWLTSGKFTDTLSFGFRKIISFNSENVATFCDSYSNSSIASSDKNDADYPHFNIVANCRSPRDTARQSGWRPYRVLPVQQVGWSSLDSFPAAFALFLIAAVSAVVVILYCGRHDLQHLLNSYEQDINISSAFSWQPASRFSRIFHIVCGNGWDSS